MNEGFMGADAWFWLSLDTEIVSEKDLYGKFLSLLLIRTSYDGEAAVTLRFGFPISLSFCSRNAFPVMGS